MRKDKARDADGNHLTGRHDDGKGDGSELLDGVVDEELAGCRGDGRNDVVPEDSGVGTHELKDLGEIAGDEQTERGDADGRGVDAKHHLVGVDVGPAVLGVDLVLPLGGEAIARDVGQHVQEAKELGGGIGVGRFAHQREDGHAECDEEGFDVLRQGVRGTLEDLAHNHDGDDLGRFEDGLDGEGHVSERRILRPGRTGVAQRAGSEGDEGGSVVGQDGTVLELNGNDGHNNGEEAIGEDTKGRRGELSIGSRIGGVEHSRHDELLHVSPRQIRRLQTAEAEGKLDRLRPELGRVLGLLGLGLVLVAHGNFRSAGRLAVDHERLHLIPRIVILGH
mmetsp:Transcript_1114/g.3144  ORF Transcript_1114/g.3144 Transcript_1114/m.3144 type:complete len:335 (+) Transcript_1114:1537-2541(+)